MDNNEQTKKLTREEQRQIMTKHWEEHLQKMKTDPQYKKEWEKHHEKFTKIALLNDTIED